MLMLGDRPRLRRGLILGLGTAIFGALLSLVPRLLEIEESIGLTALFSTREAPSVPDSVAIVGISRATAAALQLPAELDEWPRSVHAELIERLVRAGAAVIVFDIFFSEWRDSAGDSLFADAIDAAGNIVLLERTVAAEGALEDVSADKGILYQRRELPHPNFKRVSVGSGPFTLPTVPIRVGQFWIFDRGGGNVPSLPTVALQAYGTTAASELVQAARDAMPGELTGFFDASGDVSRQGLERVVQRIRDAFDQNPELEGLLRPQLRPGAADAEARLKDALLDVYAGPTTAYLNYYGPPGSIATFTYQSVMAAPMRSLAELGLDGKVVFVGLSESRQSEQVDTFYSVFSERSGRNLSGVEIGATAFANLLNRELIVPMSIGSQLLLLSGWGLALGLAMMLLSNRLGILFVVGAGVVYWLSASLEFGDAHRWLPLVVPLLMQAPLVLLLGTIWKHAVDRAHKERLRDALSSYVPEVVVHQLDHRSVSRDSLKRLVHGTCLLTDVEEYTRISEKLSPAELTSLMNEYYGVLYSAVKRFGGFVSDTAGDSMVAIWAGEKPDSAHNHDACAAAFFILDEIERLNSVKTENRLQTGIGLASGELMLSNVGSDSQFDYRAVGDVISTAARIQSLNRKLRTQVLASEGAVDSTADLRWRELGDFLFAGKSQPVRLYEMLGAASRVDAAMLESLEDFEEGLRLFRRADWSGAQQAFLAVLARKPADGPAEYLSALCGELMEQPPADAWDGVIRLTMK